MVPTTGPRCAESRGRDAVGAGAAVDATCEALWANARGRGRRLPETSGRANETVALSKTLDLAR